MNAAAHTHLLLTKQTFVALTDDTLVFLDLHRDKYSCLERQHTRAIARLLGLPVEAAFEREEVVADQEHKETATVIRDLIDRGLVTRDQTEGKRAEFVRQYSELREMLGYLPGEGPKVRVGDVVKLIKALIVTKAFLQFASMEHIVMRVKRRKNCVYAQDRVARDDERINELVELYKILKPLFVTVKDQCLFNSLFLIEFLACYGVYPDWYFGVRLNEFYAHCWVQDRNVIYDDSIMKTSANKPIMAI